MRLLTGLIAFTMFTAVAANAQRHPDQHLGPTVVSRPDGSSAADVQELALLVRKEGLSVDFGLLCAATEIVDFSANCLFRQIAVKLHTSEADLIAFNVPDMSGEIPFILLFHVARDLGEIYIVSLSGGLVRAYVKQAYGRFEKVETRQAEESFLIDMAYWTRNLSRVYEHFRVERPLDRR
jgi:hypothetical protein